MFVCMCMYVQVRVAGSDEWWRRFKLSSLAPMINLWCKPYLVRPLARHSQTFSPLNELINVYARLTYGASRICVFPNN